MVDRLRVFEQLAIRISKRRAQEAKIQIGLCVPTDEESRGHPFEERNVHPAFPEVVRALFDNGHYAQATFEAFKFIDAAVQRISGLTEYGAKLMQQAFGKDPLIVLNAGKTETEANEQDGYRWLFVGGVLAIRNPRGHDYSVDDSPDACLDHLAFASMLLRRLESAGYSVARKM